MKMNRRNFAKEISVRLGATALPLNSAVFAATSTRTTDIRVEEMSLEYEDHKYRVPIKFGGTVLDRATIVNVHCTVRTKDGRVAKGFGPCQWATSGPSRLTR